MSFLVCNHLDEEERAGCFALIVLCLATVNVLWLFLTVSWVGLQCVSVVFPDHTHLLLDLFCPCPQTKSQPNVGETS